MSSLDRRSRPPSVTAPALAIALLLATTGPGTVAAAQIDASAQKQKLEERRDANADAQRNAHELRVQMDRLEAEAVDRGLLLTLDDVEFTTNNTVLSSSGHRRLDALASFLKQHPRRSVEIAGYAGTGDYRYDQALSKRRADAVKAYLLQRDIAPNRVTAPARGQAPLHEEDSAIRQQPLRRVEVIIEDESASVTSSM